MKNVKQNKKNQFLSKYKYKYLLQSQKVVDLEVRTSLSSSDFKFEALEYT